MAGVDWLSGPLLLALVGLVVTVVVARYRVAYGYVVLLVVVLGTATLVRPVILAVFTACLLLAYGFSRLGGSKVRQVPMWLCGEEHSAEEVMPTSQGKG